MTLRAILFDAAGTLMEMRESVGETYARFASRHGVVLPAWRLDDAFKRVVARADPPPLPPPGTPGAETVANAEREWWRDVVRSTFLAADSTVLFDEPERFFDELFDHYSGLGAWSLRAGAAECLRDLAARGLRLAVASNFDHRLPNLLQALEILPFFDSIQIPSGVGCRKPAPAFYRVAAASLGAEVGETLYVGDGDGGDLEGAREAGLQAIGIDSLPGFEALPALVARSLS